MRSSDRERSRANMCPHGPLPFESCPFNAASRTASHFPVLPLTGRHPFFYLPPLYLPPFYLPSFYLPLFPVWTLRKKCMKKILKMKLRMKVLCVTSVMIHFWKPNPSSHIWLKNTMSVKLAWAMDSRWSHVTNVEC